MLLLLQLATLLCRQGDRRSFRKGQVRAPALRPGHWLGTARSPLAAAGWRAGGELALPCRRPPCRLGRLGRRSSAWASRGLLPLRLAGRACIGQGRACQSPLICRVAGSVLGAEAGLQEEGYHWTGASTAVGQTCQVIKTLESRKGGHRLLCAAATTNRNNLLGWQPN